MRGGRMRCRIQIQERIEDIDSAGGESIEFRTIHTCWAAIEPLSGREFSANQTRGAKVKTKFLLRYYEGVKPAYRLLWTALGVRTYDITEVLMVDGKRSEMILMAEELVSK